MADLWLLDSNEMLKEKLSLTKAHHIEEINGENTLRFDTFSEVEKNDRVLYRDDNDIYHEFIVQEVVEDNKSLSAYCEHSAYELHGDFVTNKRPTGTPLVHLTSILENSRWDFRVIGGFESQMISYYRISVYQSITKMLEVFKAYRTYEIEVTGNQITKRTIVIRKELGFDLGRRFVYSKDLENVTRTVMMDDIITALYGFGKGEEIGDGYGRRLDFAELDKPDSPEGKMYVEDLDALALYGRNSSTGKKHVFGDEVFDDIEDVEELYEATKEKLHTMNEPKINYTTEVILLSDSSSQVSVGDKVTIIDNDFRGQKLRLKGQVFKMKRDLLSPAHSTIQLGNYISDTADADNKLNEFVNNFRNKAGIWDRSNAFDTDGALDSSKIKDILEGWNASLNASGGFVYAEPGEGIITYDRPIDENPTQAIQINGAGWRIANSKDSEGEWDWRTLGTGDGIYGDQIIANTITTNQLSSDVGATLDISSNSAINSVVTGIGDINLRIDDIELTPGPPGEDGVATYNWIAYATNAMGIGISLDPSNKDYVGFLIGQTSPTVVLDRTLPWAWQRVRGDKGETGSAGKGVSYTEVEYNVSSSAGSAPTTGWVKILPPVGPSSYLWTRTTINYTSGDPSVVYSISKIGEDGAKGEKGDPGAKGADGEEGPRGAVGTSVTGIVEYYGLSTNDTVVPTSWTEMVGTSTPIPKMTATNKYLWNYEKINFSDITSQNTVPVIVGVYGDRGADGDIGAPGADGRSITAIQDKYQVNNIATGVTRSTGTWVNSPAPTTDTNRYLWNYEIITWNKGTTPTYVEPIVIGIHGTKGDKGIPGNTGAPGQKGEDGVTTYTWIAYADDAIGTGINKEPDGKAYVGYAFAQTSGTVSITNPAIFKWQLVRGESGLPGIDGIPGPKGEDGRPSYTWVKYADDTEGTGMVDYAEDKKYIGFAYDKPTHIESANSEDYTWSLAPQYVDSTVATLQSSVEQTSGKYDIIFKVIDIDGSVSDQPLDDIVSYFRVTPDGLLIGKSGEQVEFFAEPNRIGFRDASFGDIAYWEGTTMHVDDLIAKVSIIVGTHYISKENSSVAGWGTVVRISDS